MRGYRFLSEEFAIKAIEDKRLRVSRLHELNDPFEWSPPATKDTDQRRAFRIMKEKLGRDRGLICFSKNWSNPLLWSHYADKHRGIALGYDFIGVQPFEVLYRDTRVSCDWARFAQDEKYKFDVTEAVMCSKSCHWQYEEELRVHVALDHSTKEDGHYFLNTEGALDLKEVVLGPLSTIRKTDLIKVCKDATDEITMAKARLAFHSYDVVEQKSDNMWV